MRLPFAAVLLAVATPALAQDVPAQPSPSPQPPRREETVDVEAELPAVPPSSTAAMRVPVPVEDVPVSVSVVPKSLLRDQAAFVLADALRNASGVNAASGFGVFDVFTVRGFDSLAAGLVLTDGVPEPEATYYPTYNVRQVEVLKGPAGFLYGGNPLAGAVQIVRKQAQPGRFGDLSLTYGRFGTYEAAFDGNAARSDGRLALRLNAAWQGTDGYRAIGEGSIAAVNPTLLFRPDEKTRLAASLEYVRSEWPPEGGLPFVGASGSTLAPVARTTSYQSPFDDSVQDVTRLRLELERKVGRWTLRDRLYYTELDWLSTGTLLGGAFPLQDGRTYVFRSLVGLDDTQKLLGNQLEAATTFATGRVSHDLLVGLEVSRLTDTFVQDVAQLAPIDMLNPVELPIPPVPVPAFGLAGDGRALVLAPYVVDRMRFSPRVTGFLGARLDRLDYEDPSTRTDRKDTQLSPLLGLVYQPTSRLTLHASGGLAFAPPSTQVRGARDPETSRQAEAGVKLEFLGGKGFLGATAFVLQREDIAIPDSSGLLKQAGDQRSRGIEIDLSAEPSQGFVTYASYAYTDAELTSFAETVFTRTGFLVLDRSGNTPPFAPRHMLNVWVSKKLSRGFGVSAGLRALSDQYVGENNVYFIDGYATLDAALSYERGRARFAVNARNLTGTAYETRGFAGTSATPARPFEVLGRIDIRLGSR